jgi:hypothetical protein
MKKGNLVAAVLLFALAVAIWVGSAKFPPDSAFFPRAIAVIMASLTVVMLAESHWSRDEAVFDWHNIDYTRTVKVFAVTALYSCLLDYIGFIILTPLCLTVMMLIMENDKYLSKILASVITTLCIYLIFEVMLDVPLPVWGL